MKTLNAVIGLLALLSLPAWAGDVEIKINLPWAQPPPLVVVEPGVQVVPEYEEEVFFHDNWYWMRREGRWYRTRDHHGGWVVVPTGVPLALTRIPPGKYRHWKAEKAVLKEEAREQHRENKELKREIKEERREERHEERKEEREEHKGHKR